CQCRVRGHLVLPPSDPERDGLQDSVVAGHWLGDVRRLGLEAGRLLRFRAGQHLRLWSVGGVARPYSVASRPDGDAWLECHHDCRPRAARLSQTQGRAMRQGSGAVAERARRLAPDALLRLGELRGGALRDEPDWQERQLLLMAAGPGLAP
ncbi:hypothetical protein ACV35N_36930, partial [Pseudomonas aeruginosa]